MKQTNKPLKKFSTATIDRINRLEPEELEAHGIIQPARVSGYICPICGSGEGSHGTGMEHNKKSKLILPLPVLVADILSTF